MKIELDPGEGAGEGRETGMEEEKKLIRKKKE